MLKGEFYIAEVDPTLKITKTLKNEIHVKDNLASLSKHTNIEASNDDELMINYKGSQHGLLFTV